MTHDRTAEPNTIDPAVDMDTGLAEAGTSILLSVSTVIGLWSCTCLVSGVLQGMVKAAANGWL